MKVFVTGGTGSVGNILVGNLLESGHEVTVITRNVDSVTNDWKGSVNFVEGNVQEVGLWQQEMLKHDAIVNLVGENIFNKRWSEKQKQRIYDSRVKSIQNIADAIESDNQYRGVVVSVSGTDYYPASKEKIYTEDNEPADTFLGKVTQDWEDPIKNLDVDGLRSVIFRMGITFGYDGGGAEKMFIPHKLFVGGWIGSGDQIYSWIHIKDFAGLIEWALENDDIDGVYNGVAPEFHTMKELANIGGKVMHRWTWTWLPGIILRIMLGERAILLLEGRAVSSAEVQDAGYEFKFPHPRDAFEDILPQLSIF